MTGQERDYDEVLSRVLHSTTDRIEPVGDGLTKIQARLAEPWLKRQWWLLRNESTVLGWVLVVRCQSWFSTVRSGGAGDATADEATAAGPAGDGGRLRSLPVLGGIVAWASAKRRRETGAPRRMSVGPAMAWFRPALAVAGAVVLVVAGVFALGQSPGDDRPDQRQPVRHQQFQPVRRAGRHQWQRCPGDLGRAVGNPAERHVGQARQLAEQQGVPLAGIREPVAAAGIREPVAVAGDHQPDADAVADAHPDADADADDHDAHPDHHAGPHGH